MIKNSDTIINLLSDYASRQLSERDLNLKIMDDLGLDSFAVVELLYEIEMKFNVKASNDQVKKIITINDLLNFISSELKK